MGRRYFASGISIRTVLAFVALILGIVALIGYSPTLMLALAVIAIAIAMII